VGLGGGKLTPAPMAYPQPTKPITVDDANYVLHERELSTFQNRFTSLKVPSKYSTSLAKHVSTKRWANMKAHDGMC
jgi:hypothetical protein